MGLTAHVRRVVLVALLLATSNARALADIEVSIHGSPSPVSLGSPITYDIVIHNHGPDAAETVNLGYADFGSTVSSEAPPGWQPSGFCNLICFVGISTSQMPVGATATWRVVQVARASPSDPTTVSFGIGLRSAPADPTPTPEVLISTPVAGDGGSADLRLELLSATNPVVPGGVATYRLRLTNAGHDTAQGVSVSAGIAAPNFPSLPPATVHNMQGPAGWQCGDLLLPPRSAFCNRAAFPPGAAEFTVDVDVHASGNEFEFGAVVSATTPDPAPANNRVISGTTIGIAVPVLAPALLALLALLFATLGTRAMARPR